MQLLKAGKGKEVSYNALATHIIAEDGDNPEVGESREVFDLPVVKVNIPKTALKGLDIYTYSLQSYRALNINDHRSVLQCVS